VKQKIEICPACGKPMTPAHRLVLLVPAVVFDAVTKMFVRKWSHSGNPNLN